MTTIHVWSLIG